MTFVNRMFGTLQADMKESIVRAITNGCSEPHREGALLIALHHIEQIGANASDTHE